MKASRFLAFTALLAVATATVTVVGAKSVRQPVFNAKADVAAIKRVEEILATEIDIDAHLFWYFIEIIKLRFWK